MKNPVATTWLISFEQIRQRDQVRAKIPLESIFPRDFAGWRADTHDAARHFVYLGRTRVAEGLLTWQA